MTIDPISQLSVKQIFIADIITAHLLLATWCKALRNLTLNPERDCDHENTKITVIIRAFDPRLATTFN